MTNGFILSCSGGQPSDVGEIGCGGAAFRVSRVQLDRDTGVIEHVGAYRDEGRSAITDGFVFALRQSLVSQT